MEPHPEVTDRPEGFWKSPDANDRALWRNPAVHPYRADWFAHAVTAAPAGSAACDLAYAHPEHACELLCKDYSGMAPTIEPALAGSGEYIYRFLERHCPDFCPLRQKPRYYREALICNGLWAVRYARKFPDSNLIAPAVEWAADNRRRNGAAAAFHLLRHPRESIQPYQEQLRSDLRSAYRVLPALSSRGLVLGSADTTDPKWAYHLALSRFSRENGDYLPILRRDPVWLVGFLLARDGKIDPVLARETAAQLRADHPKHPLLPRALSVLGGQPAPEIPVALTSGQQAEIFALERLNRRKNREIYRPSDEQIASDDFKRIVGPPQYTDRGYAKGTVMDVADGEFAEIKSGHSPLEPTYQLRLQAYRAAAEHRPLRIYTNRPPSPKFTERITALGVAIEPLPE